MVTPAKRFQGWIDTLAEAWKDRLRGWMLRSIGEGVTKFTEDLEPGMIDIMRASLTKLRDNPATTPEMRDVLDQTLAEGNILKVGMGWLLTLVGIIPAALGAGSPAGNLFRYDVERLWSSHRLDPLSIMSLIRRSPEEFNKYLDDLVQQGWSDDRIDALKRVTQVLPTPRDIVGFLAHEVFEPDMIAKYNLLSEWDGIDKEFAKVIGLEEPILKLYWMDHWQHASWTQVTEMLHRGQLTEEDVWEWYRLVEIPEFWRDKLTNISWGIPNRIEIRMMARYLDMSKEEIMELLKKAGLAEEFRADAADFMIIMGLTGYWADLLRNNWISPEGLKADIEARGLKSVTAERIYKSLVKYVGPERTAKEKDLTAAEIIRGVKKEVISVAQGIELLMDLGYDEWEAEFKIAIDVAVLTGSPETFDEFKDITLKYKIATGREAKPMPEELKKAAAEVVRLTGEVEALDKSIETEKRGLVEEEILPEETTKRLKKLQVTRNRAIAELARVKSEYDRLVAEWKHGLP